MPTATSFGAAALALAAVAAVAAVAADPPSSVVSSVAASGGARAAPWDWPLDPTPAILRRYDDVGRYAPGHRGVDLTASAGQVVLSPTAGRVTFAGAVAGRRVVVVTAADGLRATLEPVTASVAVGATVGAGAPVGTIDASPRHCAVTCLHLGARFGADYRDPLLLLRIADPPVLLPLGRVG